jgi:arginine deiminase
MGNVTTANKEHTTQLQQLLRKELLITRLEEKLSEVVRQVWEMEQTLTTRHLSPREEATLHRICESLAALQIDLSVAMQTAP